MKRPSAKISALKRAEMIMKVRCGLMTGSEAATELGVSRKTYYKWEQRGLAALLAGVGDHKAGRPKKPARESALEKRLAASQAEIQRLERMIKLKQIAAEINLVPVSDRTKKK
jgi:transposase